MADGTLNILCDDEFGWTPAFSLFSLILYAQYLISNPEWSRNCSGAIYDHHSLNKEELMRYKKTLPILKAYFGDQDFIAEIISLYEASMPTGKFPAKRSMPFPPRKSKK